MIFIIHACLVQISVIVIDGGVGLLAWIYC